MSHPSVSVVIHRDAEGNVLFVWDDARSCFSLPLEVVRAGATDADRATAAVRAAARALRLPVRVAQHIPLAPEQVLSANDLPPGRYRYDVYRVNPHPDFAATPALPGAHLRLAAFRAAARGYEPLSDASRWIVVALVDGGFLPGRSQYTGVLALSRAHNGRNQFLLRHEPGWGYALPTKRRQKDEGYADAAIRAASEELGVDPAALKLPTAYRLVTTRDTSRVEEVDTFYCHGVFPAVVPADVTFSSARPLVWADANAVVSGQIRDQLDTDGRRAPDDQVSPTAVDVLQELDLVPLIDPNLVNP